MDTQHGNAQGLVVNHGFACFPELKYLCSDFSGPLPER
jgi:hypothetical protein